MIDNIKIGINTEEASEYNTVTSIKDELDHATLYIPFSTVSSVYEPFTLVDITIGSTHEYWWLDRDIKELVDYENKDTWDHRITLIELTKILERYIVPARAFAQVSTLPQFTLEDVVDNLIETVPFSDTTRLSITRLIDSVDSTLRTKLSKITSPDLFFSNKTLLEVFAEIFKIKGIDGFPRLTTNANGDFILAADFYNELLILKDKSEGIAFEQETQGSDKYATAYDIVATNQIYSFNKQASSVIEPNKDEWIGVRTDTALLQSDLTFIELQDEIEELIEIKIEAEMLDGAVLTTEIFDITSFVLEESVRNTRDVGDAATFELGDRDQFNTISYKLGSNKIENLYETFGVSDVEAIRSLYATLVLENNFTSFPAFGPQDLKFRVTYVPKINARQQVERIDLTEFATQSTLIIGQSDDFLSSDRMLDTIASRLNREGSSEIDTTITNIKDIADIYTKGTYTEDGYVLTDVERIAYLDHFDVKYQWTKNFQKISEFLGLNSRPKLFEISRTAVRNEIYKDYVILDSFSQSPTSYVQNLGHAVFMHCLAQSPGTTFDTPVNSVAFGSTDIPGLIQRNKRLARACIKSAGGNSINFWFGFNNPLHAGKQLVLQDGKYYNKQLPYTDLDGRLQDFKVKYINSYSSSPDLLPEINNPTSDVLIDTIDLRINKNQADILTFTYQLMVFPSQSNLDVIIVGDYLTKNNNMIASLDGKAMKLYLSTEIYGINETRFAKGIETSLTYTIDTINRFIEIDANTGAAAWAIGDVDGNLYMAVNQENKTGDFTRLNKVYFNFVNTRY